MKNSSMYDIFMFPLEKLLLQKIRTQLISNAYGEVLEIAFATGVNMPHYDFTKVHSLHALDIEDTMEHFDDVQYHISSAEKLPFEDASFDCVTMTLALCSIENSTKAIQEIHRILKPGGLYIFLEHQQADGKILKRIFNTINPEWKKRTGGCELIKESLKQIQKEPFSVSHAQKGVFHYGIATKD